MSNILEALRKAQDEKNRTADQAITGREALIAHRTTRSWAVTKKRVIWLGCSGTMLLAVVGWLLYGPSKPASESKAGLTAAVPVNIPAAAPPSPPQQTPPVPQPALAAAAIPLPPAPAPAIQASATLQSNGGDEVSLRRRKNRPASNPAVAAPAAAPSQAVQPPRSPEATVFGTPEGVKLTGIAWQDSRKMRRAVINDVLVGEGAVVAGTKVLEIRPGLVRFEKNGTVFEAVLAR